MNVFSNLFKVVPGNALAETALSAGDYPASGSYVDVSGMARAHCLIHTGTVHASDTPTFTFKSVNANNGTPAALSPALAVALGGSDDGEFISVSIDVASLPTDSHFLTCTVSGVTNGSYGDIIWLLEPYELPAVQGASLPTAQKVSWM